MIEFPDTPFNLEDSLILLGRRGSEAHGLYVPPEDDMGTDDRDLMGIVVPPARWYLSPFRRWEGAEAIKGCWDTVLYEFTKFVRLLAKQNPNVLGMLWLEQEDYLHVTWAGKRLIDIRAAFRAREPAHKAFTGYAYAQLKKMTHGAYRGYMGQKRRELVDRFGYDTKNASHLVRLLKTGIEYLRTGELRVRRTDDRDELLAIKRGEWTMERVERYGRDLMAEADDALAASVLPDEIDQEAIESVVEEISLFRLMAAGTRPYPEDSE